MAKEFAQVADAGERSSKLLGLEILRFVCAMAVLVWHYHHFAHIGDGSGMLRPHEPLAFILYPFYHFGLYGVQIFWAISGFIFYWKYGAALAARLVEPKRFFWLRFSRLYPLHLVTLLAVAALQPVYRGLSGESFMFSNGLADFLLQLAMADQWAGPRPMSFNGPIWSVSTEILVYVAFFMLLRTFGKSPWIIVGAVTASLASMWSGAISPAVVCAGYFFMGGAAAEWVAHNRRSAQRVQGRTVALAALAALALVPVFIDLPAHETLLTSWMLAACLPLLFLAAQDFRWLERWQAAVRAAGNLTYSTYLIHFPLQLGVAIVALAFNITLPIGEAWFLLAYLAASIVVGRIVFVRFEAPVQDLIRSVTLRPRAASLNA
jgi:peptidoglycan/LPS O-acetylase OafA/YrhL